MRLNVLVPALLLGLAPLACSSNNPNQNPNDPSQNAYNGQYQPGGQMQPGQYGQPGQQNPGYQQPGQYQPGQQQPGQQQPGQQTPGQPGQQSGGSATPIAAAAMATPLITAAAAQDAQGMSPEGGAFAGQFQEGQTLEQPINIGAGRCYTVIGVGLPPVSEVHVQLVSQPIPGAPAVPLAQDSGGGTKAVLGGGGQCFRNPLPVGGPGKIILRVAKGSGIAAAQVYSK